MATQFVRVHKNLGNGQCVQTPYVTDGTTVRTAAITNIKPMPVSTAINAGCVVATQEQINSIPSKTNSNSMAVNSNVIVPVETINGNQKLARTETAGTQGGIPQTVTFTFDNTAATAATLILGDAATLIALGLSVGAVPGTVTISGSYGASSLSYFAALTRSIPVRLHKLWMSNYLTGSSTPSTTFFDSGVLKFCRASLNNSTVEQTIVDLGALLLPSDYQSQIREMADARILIDALEGVFFTIPASQKVTFKMYLRSAAESYDMNLVDY